MNMRVWEATIAALIYGVDVEQSEKEGAGE